MDRDCRPSASIIPGDRPTLELVNSVTNIRGENVTDTEKGPIHGQSLLGLRACGQLCTAPRRGRFDNCSATLAKLPHSHFSSIGTAASAFQRHLLEHLDQI